MIRETTARPTAKILAFPIREGMRARASSAQRFAAMEAAARRVVDAAGGAWYHDEAIRETQPPRDD